jgi:hypothetical protein
MQSGLTTQNQEGVRGTGPLKSNRKGGHSSIVKLIFGRDSGIVPRRHCGEPCLIRKTGMMFFATKSRFEAGLPGG